MNRNTKKIPILSAAAFFMLLTSGCAQRASSEDLATFSPKEAQTRNTSQTTASTSTTAAPTTTKKKTTTAEKETAAPEPVSETTTETVTSGLLGSPDELEIYDIDGGGWDYEFVYDGNTFEAIYTAEPENWKIVDSYRIKNRSDMVTICTVLSGIHPIHSKDYENFRTPEDMAYEWEQHNLAYSILPKDNAWKENARDVDLDPEDQGKSLYELFKARTG